MSAFQATLIYVPLKPIVRNGDHQKKRKRFSGQAHFPEISKFFITINLLGTSSQTVPLWARDQRWSSIHLTSPLFSSNQQIYTWYILHPLFFDNFLPTMGYPNPMKFGNIWIIKQQLPQYNGSFLNFQQLKDRYEHALSSNYQAKKNTKSTTYLTMLNLQPPLMLIILLIITIIILQISIT